VARIPFDCPYGSELEVPYREARIMRPENATNIPGDCTARPAGAFQTHI